MHIGILLLVMKVLPENAIESKKDELFEKIPHTGHTKQTNKRFIRQSCSLAMRIQCDAKFDWDSAHWVKEG